MYADSDSCLRGTEEEEEEESMNIKTLERLARQALKGSNLTAQSDAMLKSGYITAAEHRSLKSLSWQIAANVQANGTMVLSAGDTTDRWWQ